MDAIMQVVLTILGALLALVSSLILVNLKGLKACVTKLDARIDLQDSRLQIFERTMKDCKIDCDRSNVSKEDWVRSESYTRTELKSIGQTLARVEGQIGMMDKLPQIVAATVSHVTDKLPQMIASAVSQAVRELDRRPV